MKEDGSVDYEAVKQSLVYVCPHCSEEFEATKRYCLSYPFVLKNQNFKLNYRQTVRIEELNKDINIYYFYKKGLKK